MKIAFLIARNLLGLLFLVFGLNGFLHFIPQPPLPDGVAKQFLGALAVSHYMVPVFLLQLTGGILLLANRFVPLALVLLGPIIVNVLLFHGLMAPEGLAPGIVTLLLFLVVFAGVRSAFAGIFKMRVSPSEA
jgi:putative oxidoreductase